MNRAIVAILLSALIFPGLGQAYKGEVRKGVFLILSASLLLVVLVLGVVVLYGYAYAELVAQVGSPEAIDPAQFQDLLAQVLTRPVILFIFGLLLATWVYGIVDAGKQTGAKSAGG